VETPADRKTLLSDLEACGGSKSIFKACKIAETVFRCWLGPEKRSERAAMHGAKGRVLVNGKDQGIISERQCTSLFNIYLARITGAAGFTRLHVRA